MSASVLNRLQSPVLALLLVLLLSSWFAPHGTQTAVQQIDFWLVWLLCMVVLALPLTLLETALARRTQTSPLQALPSLTREADASARWRGLGWLATGSLGLIAGGLAAQVTQAVRAPVLQYSGLDLPSIGLLPVVAVLAVVLSMWPRVVLVIGAVCAVAAIELSTFALGIGTWAWTAFSWSEWASAVTLALVASGLGMGVYWQQSVSRLPAQHASQLALPIWAAQVVGGVLFALAQGVRGELAQGLYSVALLMGSAYLVSMLRAQLHARTLPMLLQWAAVVAAFAVWLLPIHQVGLVLASVLGLLACLVYAVFSGWQMKISHLRKALGFDQEMIYNLWRIAMRVAIPLAVFFALIGVGVRVWTVGV